MADTFRFTSPALPLRSDMRESMEREWQRLAQPGTWWTGTERVAIAATARAAATGHDDETPLPLNPMVSSMAARIATDAPSITRDMVDAFGGAGVPVEAHVEMVGIVARLTAVDTTVRGIGAPLVPLPAPIAGEPSRQLVDAAKRRAAHVPMVGAAGATTALSAVAAEDAAQADLHGGLYLSYREMGDFAIVKDIPRWQMELAATITSWLNHCVY